LTEDKPRVSHIHVGLQVDHHEVSAEETVFWHVDLEHGPDDGNRAEVESGAAGAIRGCDDAVDATDPEVGLRWGRARKKPASDQVDHFFGPPEGEGAAPFCARL